MPITLPTVRLFTTRASMTALGGIVAGTALAVALCRSLDALLFGVTWSDSVVFVAPQSRSR
jgi:ABC-type lipoprotein release transport system permease subunit